MSRDAIIPSWSTMSAPTTPTTRRPRGRSDGSRCTNGLRAGCRLWWLTEGPQSNRRTSYVTRTEPAPLSPRVMAADLPESAAPADAGRQGASTLQSDGSARPSAGRHRPSPGRQTLTDNDQCRPTSTAYPPRSETTRRMSTRCATDESTCTPGSVARLRGPAAIHLGLPLPTGSSGLPAGIGRAALEGGQPSNACAGLAFAGPSWPCSGWGLPSHPGHPGCWWALTPPFHPYRATGAARRSVFCGTVPRVAPGCR